MRSMEIESNERDWHSCARQRCETGEQCGTEAGGADDATNPFVERGGDGGDAGR
jgi:hypothetical protein